MTNELMTRPEIKDAKQLTTASLLDRSTEESPMVLFPAQDTENFRQTWRSIQGSFVDTPRDAVQRADELVASVIQRLTEIFAGERAKLEADWTRGNEVSTEDLRLALRRYRSFVDRLLSV